MEGMMSSFLGVLMIIAGIALYYYRHRYDRKCKVPAEGVCSIVVKQKEMERKSKDGGVVTYTVENTTLHFQYEYKTRTVNGKLFSAFGIEQKFFNDGETYDILVNPANPSEFIVPQKSMKEHLEKGSYAAYLLVSNFFDFILSVILVGVGAAFAFV